MQPNEFFRDFSFLPPIARRYAEDHFKATQSDSLTMRDCCSFLGISDTTLYRYVKKGIISSSKINAYYRFDLAALALVKSGEKSNYSTQIEEEKPQRGRPRKLKASPGSLLKTLNTAAA